MWSTESDISLHVITDVGAQGDMVELATFANLPTNAKNICILIKDKKSNQNKWNNMQIFNHLPFNTFNVDDNKINKIVKCPMLLIRKSYMFLTVIKFI